MSVTQPDSAVFTTSTDTLVINGEKDEINSALATLEIDFSGVNESFDLTYSLTNNLNSDVDIVVQEFASFEFAAVVEDAFTMTGGITKVITASASDTIGSFIVETSFNNKFAEATATITTSMTGQPDGIDRAATTTNANTFSASAFGNTPLSWTINATSSATAVDILQTGASDNELYVNIPGITTGNTLVTLQPSGYLEVDIPSSGSYTIQIMSVDGSDITDYVRILSSPGVTSVNSFGELTNGTNTFNGFSSTTLTSFPDRLNADMTNLNSMFQDSFQGASSNIPGNISNWDTSNITNMGEMFLNCGVSASTIPDITSWDVSNVTSMFSMFEGSTFNQNIGSWDTGSVTNMQEMFKDATNFNYSLNSWDMANVTTINSMFAGATSYNQPVNSWTLTDLTNMESLFAGATAFNSNPNFTLPAAVTSLASVFFNATSFNQPVTWNVSNITSFSSLFNNADSFNQDISAWSIKTSGNVEFSGMFANNGGFNNGSLNSWNTVGVTGMGFMFNNSIFNQDISGWDTSNVIIMNSMFKDNTAFDQDISGWDVDSVALSTDFDTNTNVNWTSAEKPTF
jgi:surface protein